MSIETKQTFGLGDVGTIELECKSCHTIYAYPIRQAQKLPENCMNCQESFVSLQGEEYGIELNRLLGAIGFLKSVEKERPFTLRFSLTQPVNQ